MSKELHLIGLKFNQTGTAMYPWFSIQPDGDRFLCKVTPYEPEWEGFEKEKSWWDENKRAGMESSCSISADELRPLLERFAELHIADWDGYHGHRSLPEGLLDGDNGFSMGMQLDDGTVMHASGSNDYPEHYGEFYDVLMRFFETHKDYSEYYPKTMPKELPHSLRMTVGENMSPYHPFYSLEMNKGWKRWIVNLRDTDGTYLPKGTDISDYEDTEKELPLADFCKLFEKYNLLADNGITENRDPRKTYLDMHVYFDDTEKQISIRKNYEPADIDAFVRAFIKQVYQFYSTVKYNH